MDLDKVWILDINMITTGSTNLCQDGSCTLTVLLVAVRILSRATFMHQGYHPSFMCQVCSPLEWKTPSWLLVGQRQQWSRIHHCVCFEEVSVTSTLFQQTGQTMYRIFCIVGWIFDIKKGTANSTYFIYNMVLDGRKMDHWHQYRFWCLMSVATMHHWRQHNTERLTQHNYN